MTRVKFRPSDDSEWMASLEEETIKGCPILYCQAGKSHRESCMSFGWEFGNGWNEVVSELSYKLEALNMLFYPKWRVRIQFDQLKEKFGTFSGYFSIVVDPGKLRTSLAHFCDCQYRKLLGVQYKQKYVVDEPETKYDETEELVKEKWEAQRKQEYLPQNVEFTQKDGKFYRVTHLTRWQKGHYEPTQHKLKWKLKEMWCSLAARLKCSTKERTQEQEAVAKALEIMAQNAIDKATTELESTCEVCGSTTGYDEKHPRCQMSGWIKYVCRHCADESKHQYFMDGAEWEAGKMLRSKAQVEKDKREMERKWKERYEKKGKKQRPAKKTKNTPKKKEED